MRGRGSVMTHNKFGWLFHPLQTVKIPYFRICKYMFVTL